MNVTRAAAWRCPPKTIVVGVDFGEASARALAVARVVASAFESHVRAVHAERFDPPPYFTMEQINRLEAERRAAQEAAAGHLSRFAATSAFQVEPVVVDEPPVEGILRASDQADLIVLGTHGRRGPGRWWLGSVAERVVRAAAVPVLVTHADGSAASSVFERVTFVHAAGLGDDPARQCATHLAEIGGHALIEGGSALQCTPEVLGSASLVVLATRIERPSWGVTDSIARVLGSCARPLLFIPSV